MVEKRRLHGQIIERVAGVAIVFNDAPTGAGLECDLLLSPGAAGKKHHNRDSKDAPHSHVAHARPAPGSAALDGIHVRPKFAHNNRLFLFAIGP